jgi:hypothetical protein
MLAVTPYTAERYVVRVNDSGTRMTWEQCRVLGVTEKDGEPAYVVECYKDGQSWLETADLIRRKT